MLRRIMPIAIIQTRMLLSDIIPSTVMLSTFMRKGIMLG
jgi:hypothetical protein